MKREKSLDLNPKYSLIPNGKWHLLVCWFKMVYPIVSYIPFYFKKENYTHFYNSILICGKVRCNLRFTSFGRAWWSVFQNAVNDGDWLPKCQGMKSKYNYKNIFLLSLIFFFFFFLGGGYFILLFRTIYY